VSRPLGAPRRELKTFTVGVAVFGTVDAVDEKDAHRVLVDAVKRELVMRGELVREADGNVHTRLPDLPNWDDSVQYPVRIYSVMTIREALVNGWFNLAAVIKRKVYRSGNRKAE
jgi:hypothetical protein